MRRVEMRSLRVREPRMDTKEHNACFARNPILPFFCLRSTARWLLRQKNGCSDGAVFGAKLFVQSVAAELYGPERAQKRRYGKGALPDSETVVFSMRCLRGDLIGPPRSQRPDSAD